MTDTTKTEALPYNREQLSVMDPACIAGCSNTHIQSVICCLLATVKHEQAERDRLAAECEALRADAERYRWLRNEAWGGNNKTGPHLVEYKPGLMPSAVTELAEDAADAAIDAAMGGKESQGGNASGQEGPP